MTKTKVALTVSASLVAFTWIWFHSYVGPVKNHASNHAVRSIRFGDQAPSSLKRLALCGGFEGECVFTDLNVRVRSSFSGLSWNKPYLILFSLLGGTTGLQFYETRFGLRRIQVDRMSGEKLGEFSQFYWNSAEYSDLAGLIVLDENSRTIFIVSSKFGLTPIEGASDEAFVVNY